MDQSFAGLIDLIANISFLVLSASVVASAFYLFAFGKGLYMLGQDSNNMMVRPPEPKKVVSDLIGSVLFGSFTTFLFISHYTIVQDASVFTQTPVYAYQSVDLQNSNPDADLAGFVVRSAFQTMALVFLWGSFLKAIDAGKSDGSEKGALSSAISKLIAAIALWMPEVTVGMLSWVPFFDVLAALLSGTTN
ncbi:hypothetical protein BM526_19935 (plasmid) [Alteromonas mediterranea]|uniref:hypothetical protein n=1 Tax=Alteromonas mediterranea TaxID=314275 RepID=UPI0009045874|nr:hypothetical protein [Alteromonas mediterranea]APE04243.1 hypothetical protein BM526_19935 [Alteromonas mediterranea]